MYRKYLFLLCLLWLPLYPVVAQIGGGSTLVDGDGNTGHYTSLELDANDNPIISYYGRGVLNLAVCHSPTCSNPTMRVLDDGRRAGWWTSLELDSSGNPVIAYHNHDNSSLNIAVCSDPTCETAPTLKLLDGERYNGYTPSLVLDANNNPIIAYLDYSNLNLKLAVCSDPTCTAPPILSVLDSAGNVGWYPSIALDSNGNPVMSYLRYSDWTIRLAVCSDPACATPPIIRSLGRAGHVRPTSLVLDANDNPIITHADDTNDDLEIIFCDDPTCATKTVRVLDSDGNSGQFNSLTLDANGYPVVSYFSFEGSAGELRLAQCVDSTCEAPAEVQTLDSRGNTGWYTSVAIDAGGHPVISYYDTSNQDLKLYREGQSGCYISAPDQVTAGSEFTASIQCDYLSDIYGFQVGHSSSGPINAVIDDVNAQYIPGTFASNPADLFVAHNILSDYVGVLVSPTLPTSGNFTIGSVNYTVNPNASGTAYLTIGDFILADRNGIQFEDVLMDNPNKIITILSPNDFVVSGTLQSSAQTQLFRNIRLNLNDQSVYVAEAAGDYQFQIGGGSPEALFTANATAHLACDQSLALEEGTSDIGIITLLAGDVASADGEVEEAIDITDITAIGLSIAQGSYKQREDVNGDGNLNVIDLVTVAGNYGAVRGDCFTIDE